MRDLVRFAALLPLLGCLWAVPGQSQTIVSSDSVTLSAGPQYGAGGIKESFFGTDYRYLWTSPVRVPVLDLSTYAGGLTPTQRGGGLQTRSLRLQGANGREYAFRSVNKYPSLTKEPALQNTAVGKIIQDQVSALHPGAALVIPTLLDALGVPHATPSLAVMPDVEALGEFRKEFAGMLGLLEERPNEREGDQPGLAGFPRIISTDRLLERLEESPEDRVDARAYLTARLFDLLINDWDRHADQWRWGEVERGGARYWVAIPRDRDYAFVDYDGLFMRVGRGFAPNAVRFDDHISNVVGLTLNARSLDRRLLGGLGREEWDSIAASVQRRLTDELIDRAVRQMPPEYAALSADELAAKLKSRRESLPAAAARFYGMMATEVDLFATDERDLAVVDRLAEGEVRVRLYPHQREREEPSGEPYLERTFRQGETREVRIYLHGGDDRAVVRGDARESLKVRVIGGGGDDTFVDTSVGGGEETAFYDARGTNRFVPARRTLVDTREYEAPPPAQGLSGESYRDWGVLWAYLPMVNYQSTDGPIVGFGPTYTRFGFRREPYRYMLSARGAVGLASGAVALEALGDFRRANSRSGSAFRLLATQLDPISFYGFGNDTEADRASRFYVVRQNRFVGQASMYFGLPVSGRFSVGPVVKYTRTQVPPGTPFAAENDVGRGMGQVGAHSELLFDRRDDVLYPRSGALVQLGGTAYPAVWDADGPFGEAHATASTYLTPSSATRAPTLALRVGGKRVWGDFPIHEAAFLGGSATIRGYPFERFAGDALVFGNAEARVPLGQVKLLVRGQLGALALADAGRVFFEGASRGDWHTAVGGGLTFRFRIRDSLIAASALYAQGEKGRLYLKLGAPF